jgi:hypothetical protein
MGRGEYLFITPKIVEPAKPVIVTNTVTVVKEVNVPGPVREVFVEVPVKKKKE